MISNTYKIIAICLLALFSSCRKRVKDDFTNATIAGKNIEEAMSLSGRQVMLYIKESGIDEVRSVIPFENIYQYNNYDVIDINSGVIKLADISSGQVVTPGSISGSFDSKNFGVEQIFITVDNVVGNQSALSFTPRDTVIDGKDAYKLENGLPFTFASTETNGVQVSLKFLIQSNDGTISNMLVLASLAAMNEFEPLVNNGFVYGVAGKFIKAVSNDKLVLTFRNKKNTQQAVASLKGAITSSDTYLQGLISSLKTFYDNGVDKVGDEIRYKGANKFYKKKYFVDEDDSGFTGIKIIDGETRLKDIYPFLKIHEPSSDRIYNKYYNRKISELTTIGLGIGDTFWFGTNEKSMVDASRSNAKVLLSQNLQKMINPNFVVNSAMPRVGAQMDDYFVLHSNLEELLNEMKIFREENPFAKDGSEEFAQLKFIQSLNATIGATGLEGLDPSSFSHIILWYTDYLLYAGLNSYLDGDFFSRYINYNNTTLTELSKIVEFTADDYSNNNIVIRFYAVATLYDLLLGKGHTSNFDKFINLLNDKVDSSGEYGEGNGYLTYVLDIALPVMYIAMQEYPNEIPSNARDLFTRIGKNMLNSSPNWGEQVALDDGGTTIPYLAPFSVISTEADNSKYLNFTKQTGELIANGIYNNLEGAELTVQYGDAPMKVFLYPANVMVQSPWRSREDCARINGSVVTIPAVYTENIGTKTVNSHLNLSIIAENDPSLGGTHDQIDHGAIQLSRYSEEGNDANPHVDHLIIDPGYPKFTDAKRETKEFFYCNQNVQMLIDKSADGIIDIPFSSNKTPSGASDEYYGQTPYSKGDFGGMSGYQYYSRDHFIDLLHKYVLDTNGIQDWPIAEKMALNKIKAKSLSGDAGGSSKVLTSYTNGVETQINYHYKNARVNYGQKSEVQVSVFFWKVASATLYDFNGAFYRGFKF